MAKKKRTPDDVALPNGDGLLGNVHTPIEATLEPPEAAFDDRAARPRATPRDPEVTRTKPASDTVVIESQGVEPEASSQYLMVRPDRAVAAHLLVCMGANVGHRYPIGSADIVIGRSERCDIRIDDDRVSSRHAELVRRGGRYRIYDLGSANGTLVNAQRIDEIDLRDGDLIQIGYTVFKYTSEDASERSNSGVSMAPSGFGASGVYGQNGYGQNGFAVAPSTGPGVPSAAQAQNVAFAQAYAAGAMGMGLGARARDEDDDVSLTDVVMQLRKIVLFFWPYRWVMAGLMAAGLVVGALSVVFAPPAVIAFFDVRLHSKASENPLEKFESSNVEFFRSAATTFRSTGLITKTLQALGEPQPSAERIQSVQNRLQFSNTGSEEGSQTYTGTFADESADEGLKFLGKHVAIYLDNEIDKTLKIIGTQVEFLKGQLAENEKTLKETEERLTEFKKKNIDGLPDQARQYYDYLFELQKKEADLDGEASRLAAEAAVDERRLQTESPLVESRVTAVRPYQQAIVEVNQKLASARASGLADDHPDVRQLKTKLDELKRLASDAEHSTDDTEVERSRNPIYESTMDRMQRLHASAAATHQERVRLREDQARIKDIVDRLPQLEAQYADLTRSYDATKALHTRIFDQLKTTELQFELERASATARYEIISAPQLAYSSLSKTVAKRSILAGLIGLVCGILIATMLQVKKLLAAFASNA